jgi:hypothetical protein
LFKPYYENTPLYHFCRISHHGLAFYESHFNPYRDSPISEELTIPDINLIFKTLFEENGLELRETNGTQITNQVINLVGGFENLRLFNNKNVFKLLVELTPKRTERLAKLLAKNLNSSLSIEKIEAILSKNKDALITLNSNLIIKTSKLISYYSGKDDEKYHQQIQQLYEKKILLRGKSFRCPYCKSLLWYPTSSLEDDLKCYCCDNSVSLPIFTDNGVSEDSFRLNELIINAVDQGVLPVLLTTSILYKQGFILHSAL